jgi:hypothetical protein
MCDVRNWVPCRKDETALLRRDLWIVLNAAVIVVMTAAWTSFDFPPGQSVVAIWAGRLLINVVLGAAIVSIAVSSPGPQPIRLLPQTQLLLWGLGLVAIIPATDGLHWLEPTRNFWIGMVVMLTIGFRVGLLWLGRQVVQKLVRGKAS